jgi:Ca2+:H+ antiporter
LLSWDFYLTLSRNAVEVIVSIIALVKDEIVIVKTSLIGSILSNLLLVMGMCFFFGGLRREQQFFNTTVASTATSLLALAIASVIIPTAFDKFALGTTDVETDVQKLARTAAISRGSSIILLFVYACYLYFQLKTHSAMYQEESRKVAMRASTKHKAPGSALKGVAAVGGLLTAHGRSQPVDKLGVDQEGSHDEIMQRDALERQAAQEKEEDDEPQLHIWVAVATLVCSTVVIAICAEFMVGSIDKITQGGGISAEFVGLILLPIVGNAAEHATAVTVAVKDKMDLAIGVAVGSSMQVSLLVIPLTVIIGWIIGKDDMNLSFDGFQVAVLFVSVLLVNYLISDGRSNYLEGVLLQCLYLIIAVTYVAPIPPIPKKVITNTP